MKKINKFFKTIYHSIQKSLERKALQWCGMKRNDHKAFYLPNRAQCTEFLMDSSNGSQLLLGFSPLLTLNIRDEIYRKHCTKMTTTHHFFR